jgi:hypothetical protein
MTKTKTAPALIKGYPVEATEVNAYDKIFDTSTRTFKPLTTFKGLEMHEMLDSIALAVEAGVVEKDGWVKQIFTDKDVFKEFLREFAHYDKCFRVNDRWYAALQRLAGGPGDEEGFITCDDIVNELLDVTEADGQM